MRVPDMNGTQVPDDTVAHMMAEFRQPSLKTVIVTDDDTWQGCVKESRRTNGALEFLRYASQGANDGYRR